METRTGKAAEILRGREGAVEEEGDVRRRGREELAKHLGDEQEVVVVDPDLKSKVMSSRMRRSTC